MNIMQISIFLAGGFLCPMLLFKYNFKKKQKRKKVILNRDDTLIVQAYGNLINAYLTEFKEERFARKFLLEYFEYNPILFEDCVLGPNGTLDITSVMSNIERLPETERIDEINTVFSDLISGLHEIHSDSTFLKRSEDALTKSYQTIKNNYGNSPLIFDILRNLPKGILEEERIALLPRDELEMRVRERTKKLIEVNLALENEIKERKKIEKALERQAEELSRTNSELEQFFFVASHHLQEPIRIIISYSQLLKRRYNEHLDEEADTYMSFITEGALRIQDLVNDVRTISQINTHGKPFAQVDCSKLIETIITRVKNTHRENPPSVIYESLPVIIADKQQLTKVFSHLIDNAIKYCGVPVPEIHISAKTRKDDYLFIIRDNGIGIGSQYFDKVFMIFQRLHTNQKYKGTGVGLALCKKIIERHGGRIWVESEGEGKGSTFYFTIPQKPNM